MGDHAALANRLCWLARQHTRRRPAVGMAIRSSRPGSQALSILSSGPLCRLANFVWNFLVNHTQAPGTPCQATGTPT